MSTNSFYQCERCNIMYYSKTVPTAHRLCGDCIDRTIRDAFTPYGRMIDPPTFYYYKEKECHGCNGGVALEPFDLCRECYDYSTLTHFNPIAKPEDMVDNQFMKDVE
jgi:hypothetical protein